MPARVNSKLLGALVKIAVNYFKPQVTTFAFERKTLTKKIF